MSLYFETLYAWKCKGTHHKLAMDALTLLTVEHADEWSDLFLRHIESYLTGSKDPDTTFKDFRNHVLHVGQNYWGGAITATQKWYAQARQAFADGNWREGVYSAGVMSHYLTDVFCPLHTDQSDRENVIHRACEWSISCSYDALLNHLQDELGGFPTISPPTGGDWLPQLIQSEAAHAHFLYSTLVDQYDFDKGVKDPLAGLNEALTKEMALTLGRACATLALVLDRCLKESGQKPPGVALSLHALLGQVTIPIFWITKKMDESASRNEVLRIYNELQATGKVEKNLPEENRVIRELVRQRDLGEELPETPPVVPPVADAVPPAKPRVVVKAAAAPAEKQSPLDPFQSEAQTFGMTAVPHPPQNGGHEDESEEAEVFAKNRDEASPPGNGRQVRHYLRFDSPIVDAPSIGPKTAARFHKIHLDRVHDLLTTDARTISEKMNTRWITPDLVIAWQQQAELMCSVPGLRGHDAQLLQGVGVENYLDLAHAAPEDLLALVQDFVHTTEGQQILRNGRQPDLAEVTFWIENARAAARNQAA